MLLSAVAFLLLLLALSQLLRSRELRWRASRYGPVPEQPLRPAVVSSSEFDSPESGPEATQSMEF